MTGIQLWRVACKLEGRGLCRRRGSDAGAIYDRRNRIIW
jgi:hypothetical protein